MARVYRTAFEQVQKNMPDDERRRMLAALHQAIEGAIVAAVENVLGIQHNARIQTDPTRPH